MMETYQSNTWMQKLTGRPPFNHYGSSVPNDNTHTNTHTHTHTHTYKQRTPTNTHTHTHRERETHTHRHTHTFTERKTDIPINKKLFKYNAGPVYINYLEL